MYKNSSDSQVKNQVKGPKKSSNERFRSESKFGNNVEMPFTELVAFLTEPVTWISTSTPHRCC